MRILSFIPIFVTAASLSAARAEPVTSGFVDLNYYPVLSDVDQDTFLTVNALVNLPARLQYFSFTNLAGNDSRNPFSSNNQYYTEQNLRWKISPDSPLDLTAQWNLRSGSENDRLRLGFRWRLNNTSQLQDFFESIHLAYSINFHAIQFDHESPYVWQMEHVARMTLPYWTDRLYLSGFIDHTINGEVPDGAPSAPIVLEAQAGYRLFSQLYAVAEYRINEYRRNDEDNLAIGLQYRFSW
ncbi:MAG: hypothetical protein P8L44_02565 [Opitutales bacterium]|nr:hypothetical protein [Opitutales bacterium]